MSFDVYQTFMTGYVRRINEATLNVQIGGVKIGAHKKIAQVNLRSRLITFSQYAIENVPERSRRYLVIHQLAHLVEPSHGKAFWDIVAKFEPNYKQVGRSLELAFRRNVREDQLQDANVKLPNPLSGRLETPKLLLSTRLNSFDGNETTLRDLTLNFAPLDDEADCYHCTADEFGEWTSSEPGIVHGGSDYAAVPVDEASTSTARRF